MEPSGTHQNPKSRCAGRRRFLASAAASTAAIAMPTILPRSVLAAPGRPGANDRIGVAFIGCGRQTYFKNIPLFVRTAGVQPIAVCDVDQWRLDRSVEQIKQQYDSGRAQGTYAEVSTYVDYRDVLARDDVDAVCIGTPDHWHRRMALEAMEAGKDIALEKPIARTIRDSQSYIEAAKKYGRVFRVDSEFRSGAPSHRATSLVRNGYIGKVQRVEVIVPVMDRSCPAQSEMPVPKALNYKRWLGDAPAKPYTEKRVHPRESFDRPGWFSLLDYSDGVITNWGAHLNGGAMWATGEERTGPVEISGTGRYLPHDSFYDQLAEFDLTYRFADGIEWRYRTAEKIARFRITGDEGWVEAGFHELDAEPKSLLTVDFASSDQPFPLLSEKQDFINCVRSREETLEPPEVGHRVNSLGKLGHICVHLGRPLRWDPHQERFPEDEEAETYIDKPILQRPTSGR